MFTVISIVLFILSILTCLGLLFAYFDDYVINRALTGTFLALAVVFTISAAWFQSHGVVPTQHIGITKSSLSQELNGMHGHGIVKKPFFGSVHKYPASSSYQRCEKFTPAIKGSYGVTIDLCFYYDAGQVDWLAEVGKTGSLDASSIMSTWRNSVVGDVAKSVKDFTPESLSDNRSEVERAIFANVKPWFSERNIPLVNVSFKNWDFTSKEVAKAFDESIVSQRKITEQAALLEAAKISREREEYEAETAKLVAEWQKEALNELGFDGPEAVEYMWIKMLSEKGKSPDILILGGANAPLSIPSLNSGTNGDGVTK